MIKTKKKFILKRSELGSKFRVENNNLDLSPLIEKNEFRICKLKDIAAYHRENRNVKNSINDTFKYIQISDIDCNLGIIKSCTMYKGSDAPNNARRIIRKDDIIISTRRPTRGAIVAVPEEFDGEICSVFFTSVRVHDKSIVNPQYLALFLRTSFCRYQFQSMITETAYPVISDDDILDMIILLPSMEEQLKLANQNHTSLKKFIYNLNVAYKELITNKQEIEDYILKNESEKLIAPRFDLQIFDSDGNEISDKEQLPDLIYFKNSNRKQKRLDKFF